MYEYLQISLKDIIAQLMNYWISTFGLFLAIASCKTIDKKINLRIVTDKKFVT